MSSFLKPGCFSQNTSPFFHYLIIICTLKIQYIDVSLLTIVSVKGLGDIFFSTIKLDTQRMSLKFTSDTLIHTFFKFHLKDLFCLPPKMNTVKRTGEILGQALLTTLKSRFLSIHSCPSLNSS